MNIKRFIADLSSKGVELWVQPGNKIGYRGPKDILTAAVFSQIKEYKSAIIGYLSDALSDFQMFPVSHGQKALWFINHLLPQSPAYNIGIPLKIKFERGLDLEAMQRTFQWVVDRHPMLRTTFKLHGGEPVQVIHDKKEVYYKAIDAFDWDEKQLSRKLAAAYEEPFDLGNGPLFKVFIFLLTPNKQEYICLLAIHHIVFDGWSSNIIFSEALLRYYTEITGIDIPIPAPQNQYSDYVKWQNDMIASEEGEALWKFWEKRLSGDLPIVNLKTDKIRPPVQTNNGKTLHFRFPVELTRQAKLAARNQSVTDFMFFIAIYLVLLNRYTDQTDLIVGIPANGRTKAEFSEVVGYFINPVIMRSDLSGNPTFSDFLKGVRRNVLETIANQDYPLALIIDKLKQKHDASRSTLFQVMFNFIRKQNQPIDEMITNVQAEYQKLTGHVSMEMLYELPEEEGQFDLTLGLWEEESTIRGQFKFNTDLFVEETIERMVAHYQNLLKGIIDNPDLPISEIPLLTKTETRKIFGEWNKTAERPNQGVIHQLIEKYAASTPDAIALTYNEKKISYKALNQQANQLAKYLRKKGVGPNTIVAVYMEYSENIIISILGILKAGGAYLPLDPTYPEDRLTYILEDSSVQVVVTHAKIKSNLNFQGNALVVIDEERGHIQSESTDNLPCAVTPDDLVYLIYTSASTGEPKGVLIRHKNLLNAYYGWEEEYRLHSIGNRHLQMAAFSFDVFAGDFVRALCSGGKLVLCPRSYLLDPELLYRLMVKEKVDIAEFIPAVLRYLIQYLKRVNQDLSFMRLLNVGSDSFYMNEYKAFKKYCGPETRFINTYGITEATIDSSYFEHTDIKLSKDRLVPIGKPFPNTQMIILDRYLNPVPVGVVGELYIGGANLAIGYHNLPELTREKFISHPFAREEDARLYKTGDLACYLDDGNIEFLGRADFQIKIRGFRVEMEEIETAILEHPLTKETAVIAHDDSAGTKQLLAFISRDADKELTSDELRGFLSNTLPEYMIPAHFVFLDNLPLLPNGKIDRKTLPIPDKFEIDITKNYCAPGNELETSLVTIWEELLQIQPVGVYDNFFNIGGNSILAVRLIAKIHEKLHKKIPISVFYKDSTIEKLAIRIKQEDVSSAFSSLVAIQAEGTSPPFFCVHPIGGTTLCYIDLAHAMGVRQRFYGLQAPGVNGQRKPLDRIEDLASNYIGEMRKVQPQGPYSIGGWSLGGIIAFEMAIQLKKQGQDIKQLVIIDLLMSTVSSLKQNDALFQMLFNQDMGDIFGRDIAVSLNALRKEKNRADFILNKARQAEIKISAEEQLQTKHLIKVYLANMDAMFAYRPLRFSGDIDLFMAQDTLLHAGRTPENDWREIVDGNITVHEVPGDHNSIMQKPNVFRLGELLNECMDRG